MSDVRASIADELPFLHRYALFLTRDGTKAEDLVQDCVTRAIDRETQYQSGTNLRAWLFTILRGLFLNDLRSGNSRPSAPQESATQVEWSVRANQEDRAEMLRLDQALSRLSSDHRDVLFFVVIEGFSYEETACLVEAPIGTVRSRLARARGELSRQLDGIDASLSDNGGGGSRHG